MKPTHKQYHFSLKAQVYEFELPVEVIAKIKDLEKRLKFVNKSHFDMCGTYIETGETQ